jgi:hypothetical protein
VFERRSALAQGLSRGGRDGADGRRALTLGEVRGWSLVQLAAFSRTLPELANAARPLLGGDLPTRTGTVAAFPGRLLFKVGPEKFWVLSPDGQDLVPALQSAISPEIGAVTALSHSRAPLCRGRRRSSGSLHRYRPRPAFRKLPGRRLRPDRRSPHSRSPATSLGGSLRALRASHIRPLALGVAHRGRSAARL